MRHGSKFMKRALDLVGAIVGLFVFTLLAPLIAVAILLEDGAPIFFTGSDVTGDAAVRRRRAVWLALKTLAASAALWLAFRRVDLPLLWDTLHSASVPWVALSLTTVVLALASAVLRWRILFYPDHHERSWRNLACALVVGQAVNIALPLRLGEVARVYAFSAAEGVAAVRVAATIAVERLADVLMLGVAAAALLLAAAAIPLWLRAPGQALLVAGAAAAGVVLLLGVRGDLAGRWADRATRTLPARLEERVRPHVHEALSGLRALRSPRASLALWTLSAAGVALAVATNYLLFVAFGLSLPVIAALFLFVVLVAGNTAVSVPGNLGVFHYLTVLALGVYGVGRDVALAYAIVLYAVALLSKIVLGVLIMTVGPHGFSFQAVRDLARRGNE